MYRVIKMKNRRHVYGDDSEKTCLFLGKAEKIAASYISEGYGARISKLTDYDYRPYYDEGEIFYHEIPIYTMRLEFDENGICIRKNNNYYG